MHSGSCHWVTVSTIACPPSTVVVYDSLYSALPTQTKEQICSLLHSQEPSIQLNFGNVQSQNNSCDCGVFALAFLTALCEGKHPEELYFKRNELRQHLLKCLEVESIIQFPSKVVRRRKKITRRDYIKIFCSCRTQEGGKMIECANCKEWFHEECVVVSKKVWQQPDYKWSCENCC